MKRLLFSFVLCSCMILVACATPVAEPQQVAPKPVEEESVAEAPKSVEAKPEEESNVSESLSLEGATPGLSEVVEEFDYLLSAIAIEDPSAKHGVLYEPNEDTKLVGIEFIVGNVAGTAFSSNVLYTTLLDGDGFAYRAETGAIDRQIALLDVEPGEKVRGWAGFVLPKDAKPAAIKYSFGGSSKKTITAGLQRRLELKASVPQFEYVLGPSLPALGEAVDGPEYYLSAITVENPSSQPGIFFEPLKGSKLIGVEFVVGNVAAEQYSSNVLYASLMDSEGFVYEAETGIVENQLELLDLGTGEKVKGWAGFIVPESAEPIALKYAFDGDSSKGLMVGLTEK